MWTRTVKWDVAPPAWAKQIEHGRVLVIFCPPYLIDIPLEPARCRCARAMIRALLGVRTMKREEHANRQSDSHDRPHRHRYDLLTNLLDRRRIAERGYDMQIDTVSVEGHDRPSRYFQTEPTELTRAYIPDWLMINP